MREKPFEWQRSVTPIQPPAESIPHTSDLVYAGIVTGSWSGILSLVVYAVGRMLGVPFEVFSPLGGGLQVVPWLFVIVLPLVVGVVGGYAAALTLGKPHARRLVFWIGTGLAVASLTYPLAQPAEVIWSTRLWLSVNHLIAWFLIVPQLARIAGDSEPGATAPPIAPS